MTEPLQFSLDYDRKLPPSAQIGMQQADENADSRWKRIVDACVMAVAEQMQEFTVDDVLAKLNSLPFPPKTHNNSALGPRMVEISRSLKYMTATDRKVRSKTGFKHGNIRTVWRSNLWKQ